MRRAIALLAAAVALLAVLPTLASAHPLGNFTVNTYVRAELSGEEIYVRYVLDLAEIPAFRERGEVEAAGGLEDYAASRAPVLGRQLLLEVDGRPLPLAPVSETASWRRGEGGLQVLRLAAWYRSPDASGLADSAHRLTLRDETYADRIGWHEIVARASSGAEISGSTVPTEDLSNELRDYPRDLLSSPVVVRQADLTWTPGEGPGTVGPLTQHPESQVDQEAGSGLGGLVEGDLTLGVILLALVLAAGWGALHAISPGHGKTMVAAYLVGTRATARHALVLGAFVTLTHTAVVILLGLVTLWASRYVLPETLFPWLNLAAALLVVAIGAWVLWSRSRGLRRGWAHRRAHVRGRSHEHEPTHAPSLVLAGAGAGMSVHDDGHHHHDHHRHTQADHGLDHGHGHHGEAGHQHHGRGGHSHAPPGDLSLRSLVAVGASAGIVPCPSALVLLLGAISLHRVGYGLVLVVAFSLGLAAVLMAIGLLVLRARRLLERLPTSGRLASAVPVASALVIVGIGIALTARAVPGILS